MAEIFNFYVQDNRTIQFPKNNLLEPIMQEDYKVATWRFRIPKTLNGIDMSGYAWWFVYVNAGGQEFSELLTLVDDVDEPDSFCTADYSIDYDISYHPGNFQFSLEAINADSGGEVLNEWHTKTYAHKVDKTLQGNQAQWAETESDIISALIIEVQNKVAQLTGGATPEPKNLIADMTDTSKVYLYVGTETGYTAGNWYYYNGSAWTSGGVYASGIVVDSTPTQGSTNAVSSGGVYEITADLDARVGDLEQGGAGGLSMTAINLLNTILTEAVYGSDQTANIALLKKELSNIPPVSISAVLDGTALAGQSYSELSFIVTATFDDESTQVVDNYTIVTTGTVTAGSNTVTIRYKGITTTCTFTAEQVTTYSITYNLTDVTSSSDVSVVRENAYYNTVLSVPEGYAFNSCTVTMGGVDITSTAYSNMEILITQVTGNVVITASATEITYMDDLLPTRNGGFSNVYGYPNGSTEDAIVIGSGYHYTPFVSEYPAQNNCTIHWTIKNISETDISLENCGFGNINPNDVYGASAAIVKAFYCVKSDNSAHTLTPGAELEGDVVIKSGMQLCFVCKYADFSKFEVKLAGNYTPDTFSGYTEINPIRENTQEYGSYRIVAYYKDSGSELIANKGGTPRKIDINLEAGTYDMYCSVQADEITNDIRNVSFIVGGMDANTDTTVYYAGGTGLGLNAALWFHFTFTLENNGMTLVTVNDYINYMNNVDAKIRFMYKKVVQ